MEVENVGKKPKKSVKKLTTKSKWIILFSVFGVAIVGLVIAIVVVLVNRNNDDDSQEIVDNSNQTYDEALQIYLDDNEEISGLIVENNLEGEAMLKLLKEKIDTTENEIVKAMLEKDYYMTMIAVYGVDKSKKDEILDGLVRVDEVLQTSDSAESVVNAAIGYNDYKLWERYIAIAKERDPDYQSIFDIIEEDSE